MAKKELTNCTSRQPESQRITPAQLAIKLCGEARVGLGCMGLTGIYGAVSPESAADTLHAALDAGITLFDTAALYASGANEEMLGKVLGRRSDINVVTKFGLYEGADGALLRDSRPSTIRASVEASLRRLRRDRLDLVLQHRPDPAVPDHIVAETVSALINVKSLPNPTPISRAMATLLAVRDCPLNGLRVWSEGAVGKWPAGATVKSLA